jgi:hypothetical protein
MRANSLTAWRELDVLFEARSPSARLLTRTESAIWFTALENACHIGIRPLAGIVLGHR